MFSLFQDPQQLALLGLTLLISLTLHEFAHAWVAYRLGDDTAYREGRVTLNPLVHLDLMGSLCFLVSGGFGWARPVPVTPTNLGKPRRDDILVTGAGPLSNFLLGTLCAVIFYLFIFKQFSNQHFIWRFMSIMVTANFFLAFFNLLPLFPLDGSHIVTNLLPLNQAYRFKRFNDHYGSFVLLGLIILPYMTNHRIDPISWLIRDPVYFIIGAIRGLVGS